MKIYQLALTFFMLILGATLHAETNVAMITALEGQVSLMGAANHVEAFVKLKVGDILYSPHKSKIQIIYFENGRQELWEGAGKLEITATEGRTTDIWFPKIKQIPINIVKQMAHTPSLDSQGRAGVTRLRAIPTPDAITKIENTYKEMRTTAGSDDLNPELYLLSGMFNLKQFNRVEEILNELKRTQPNNKQVKVLLALYGRALRDAQISRE